MGADERVHHELADFRIAQILWRRLLRAFQELLTIDDLQNAALAAAVAEINAVDGWHRDRPMQLGRHRAGGARLLTRQAEIADLHRLRRIAEIVDFGHALDAPARHTRDDVGNAGVAFPPALVRVAIVAADRGDPHRIGAIGDVPDFVALGPE